MARFRVLVSVVFTTLAFLLCEAQGATCLAGASDSEVQAIDRVFHVDGVGCIEARTRTVGDSLWEGTFQQGRRTGSVLEMTTSCGPVVVIHSPDGSSLLSLPDGRGGASVRPISKPPAMPLCRTEAAPFLPCATPDRRASSGQCDDGDVIDVLLKWTSEASAGAGGEVQIRAMAEACIVLSNHIYMASGVTTRLRAVGFGNLGPFEEDPNDILFYLGGTADGVYDDIHAERDAVGADLVAVLYAGGNFGGRAYGYLGPDRPDAGFSTARWEFALTYYTFTHEVGHNQGCCHAPGDGGGCGDSGYFPYSLGNRFDVPDWPGSNFATVMAYAGVDPNTRARIPRFSGPDSWFNGQATGSAERDNVRTINETSAGVANFRCSVVPDDGTAYHLISQTMVPSSNEPFAVVVEGVPRAGIGSKVEIWVVGTGWYVGAENFLDLTVGGVPVGSFFVDSDDDCVGLIERREQTVEWFNDRIDEDGRVTFKITKYSDIPITLPCEELRIMVRYLAEDVAGPCVGDVNGDGRVDGADLGQVFGAWGDTAGAAAEDLNHDGQIDAADIGLLLSAWGPCE